MKLPDRNELDQLMTSTEKPWVSIYMPAHRPGAEGQQDPIRLKNLVRQAEERLIERGVRSPDARKLLAEPTKLIGDTMFWREQSDGLALFCAPSSFKFHRLPLRFDEMLIVADKPYLRPLLPLFASDSRFFLLAISKQQLRFFVGSRFSMEELKIPNVPHSLDEALKYDEFEKPRRARWVQPTGQGRSGHSVGGTVYRGLGVEGGAQKDYLLQYFQMVDKGLHNILREESAPLVIAAVDYVIPIYREANSYGNILVHGVEGSPDSTKLEDLHRDAWKVVEPYYKVKEEDAVARFNSVAGTGRAVEDIRTIVPAAAEGRIDTLWVARGVQVWGRFDPTDNSVLLHDKAQPGDQELIELAAIQSILNGGTVYPFDGLPPSSRTIAAIFRY